MKKFLSILLAILMLAVMLPVTALAADGDGSQSNPYTLAQFNALTRQQYIDAQNQLGGTMYVTVDDYSYDKEIAFQQINARMRALESDRQTRNQRNARNGTNYIPFFLQSQIDACRGMMKDLQEAEELFRVGLYISISAHSMEELEDITKVIIGACRQHLVSVKRATMRQEDGLASILPLGQDRLQLAPYMMTSGLSMLLPFTLVVTIMKKK